jgi:Domain of unknown function (DUF4333)
MDVASISPGRDFEKVLRDAVATCDVVLVLIGKNWLWATDARGRRRLDDPLDIVAAEIRAGLDRDIAVIPVLVEGVAPVRERDLPRSLASLARRQGIRVDHDSFSSDSARLIEMLESEFTISRSVSAVDQNPVDDDARDSAYTLKGAPESQWRLFGFVVGGALVFAVVVTWIILASSTRQSSNDGGVRPTTSVARDEGGANSSSIRIFDQKALEHGVAAILRDDYEMGVVSVSCPSRVAVVAGSNFSCTALVDGSAEAVPIHVTSNAGDYEVGRPTS